MLPRPCFALFAALLGGCAARIPAPCSGPSSCGPHRACIVGVCRPPTSELAPLSAQRVVVTPDAIALSSSRGDGGTNGTPAALTFGAETTGSVVLLLHFPTPWGPRARIASAFLTLAPAPGALPEPETIALDVMSILGRWSPSQVDWLHRPRLSVVQARALAKTAPPRPLRIDVTSIVTRWQRDGDGEGLALAASPTATNGVSYASGAAGGLAPRLEVYVR